MNHYDDEENIIRLLQSIPLVTGTINPGTLVKRNHRLEFFGGRMVKSKTEKRNKDRGKSLID